MLLKKLFVKNIVVQKLVVKNTVVKNIVVKNIVVKIWLLKILLLKILLLKNIVVKNIVVKNIVVKNIHPARRGIIINSKNMVNISVENFGEMFRQYYLLITEAIKCRFKFGNDICWLIKYLQFGFDSS